MIKNFKLFNILSTLFWLSFLSKTDSFFDVYALIGIINIIFICKNNIKYNKKYLICSIILSLCVSLSNYNILDNISLPIDGMDIILNIFKCLVFILLLICGIYVFYGLVYGLDKYLNKIKLFSNNDLSKKNKVFIKLFLIIFSFYSLILILCMYPGILTPDSLWQVEMGLTNNYNLVHPILHTWILELIISLFNDLRVGIFACSLIQILFISFCISYMFTTLYEIGLKKKYLIISYIIFLLLPFNIIYSFTIWKDVVFAGFVLLFTTSLFRELYKIGNNLILLFIGGIGFCLFRTNGLYAFVLFSLFFIIFKFKEYKKISRCLIICCILSIGFNLIINSSYKGPSISESLSIPLQQISRTVVDERLSKDEIKIVSKYLDIDKVKGNYLSYISDPIKNIMKTDNFNMKEFINDWFKLFIKHPISYIKAYIDQTRGYYNGGYDYGWFSEKISNNSLGLETISFIKPLYLLFMGYLWLFSGDIPILTLIRSLGLYTWIVVILFSLAKKQIKWIYIPLLCIIATLLIATPVFCEFRYMYCIVICIPLIIFGYLYGERHE